MLFESDDPFGPCIVVVFWDVNRATGNGRWVCRMSGEAVRLKPRGWIPLPPKRKRKVAK